MKNIFCVLFIIICILCGCSSSDEKRDIQFLNENKELIFSTEISPNGEYIENEAEKVVYDVMIYQDDNNVITVYANSNSAFFKEMKYEIKHDEKITEADVIVTWTTLMGNTEFTEKDQLAVANIVIMQNGEVFSERKINFVKGAIEILIDVID